VRSAFRNNKAYRGTWEENRRQLEETEFSSNDPTVLVIGSGHSDHEIAARLKYIGVPTLMSTRSPEWATVYVYVST